MHPPTPTAAARAPRPRPGWRDDLVRRFCHHQPLKVAGIVAFTTVFFVSYFWLLDHPSRPPVTMPLTRFDDWIGFEPAAIWPYVSLWVYICIAPGLAPTLRDAGRHGLRAAAMCALGLAIFWVWPTAVPVRPPHVEGSALFALLRGVDAAGNACPSLHVAAAWFSAAWNDRLLRDVRAPLALRAANGAWFALIAWSTVATRQHVVLDGVAGLALGALFSIGAWRHAGAGRRVAIIGATPSEQSR
jgi:hypothetical protein